MNRRHIIQSLEFDITVSNESEGRELMTPIEDVIKNRLVRTIEEIFDEIDIEGEVIRAELLELDLGEISIHDLDSEFDFRLREKLNEILSGLVLRYKEEEVEKKHQERKNNDQNWVKIFVTTGTLPWWMNVSTVTGQSIQEEISQVFRERPNDLWNIIVEYYLDDHVQHRLSKYINQEELSRLYSIPLDVIKIKNRSLISLFPELSTLDQKLWEAVLYDKSGVSPDEKAVNQFYNIVSNKVQETLTKAEWLLWVKIQPQVQTIDEGVYKVIVREYEKVVFSTFHFFQSTSRIEKLDIWVIQKSYIERSQIMREIFSKKITSVTRTEKLISLMTKVGPLTETQTERLSQQVWSKVMKALIMSSGSQLKQEIRRIDKEVLSYVSKIIGEPEVNIIQKIVDSQEVASETTEILKTDLDKLQSEILEKQEKMSFKTNENDDVMIQVLNFMLFGLGLSSTQRELIGDLIRYLIGVDLEIKPKNILRSREEYITLFLGFVKALIEEEVIFIIERILKTDLLKEQKSQMVALTLSDHSSVMTIYEAIETQTYEFDEDDQEQQIGQILRFYISYGRAPFQTNEVDKSIVLSQLEQRYPKTLRGVIAKLSAKAQVQLNNLYDELELVKPFSISGQVKGNQSVVDSSPFTQLSPKELTDKAISSLDSTEGKKQTQDVSEADKQMLREGEKDASPIIDKDDELRDQVEEGTSELDSESKIKETEDESIDFDPKNEALPFENEVNVPQSGGLSDTTEPVDDVIPVDIEENESVFSARVLDDITESDDDAILSDIKEDESVVSQSRDLNDAIESDDNKIPTSIEEESVSLLRDLDETAESNGNAIPADIEEESSVLKPLNLDEATDIDDNTVLSGDEEGLNVSKPKGLGDTAELGEPTISDDLEEEISISSSRDLGGNAESDDKTISANTEEDTSVSQSQNLKDVVESSDISVPVDTEELPQSADDQKGVVNTDQKSSIEEQKDEIPKKTTSEADDEPIVSKKLEERAQQALISSVYIRNAGLVILAPYLSKLFDRVGLLDEKKMLVGQRNKIKAIEWLHYLVFGIDEMEEYDSLLSKIITDLPISVSLPAKISLTQEEKDVCNGLLKAVITNWSALKGSSEDNLRGSFLIREGKLTKEDAQFVLIIEEKGYDLLIDRIPWSFKLINYKWMERAIFVEWR